MMRTKSALTRAALVEVGEGNSGRGNDKQVVTTSGNNACEEKGFCFVFHKREK